MKSRSNAKINLFLQIVGKNPASYHLLESLVVFTKDIFDEIFIEESEFDCFTIDGEFASKLETSNNSVITALNLIRTQYKIDHKLDIKLIKNLPVAAGIGGGTSNAATIIKDLEKLWSFKFDEKLLLTLGADVPVCYARHTSFVTGIGEHITTIDNFPKIYLVLANPMTCLSTKEIFANLKGNSFSDEIITLPKFTSASDLCEFLSNTRNDLENVATKLCPPILELIKTIASSKGCNLARMSGSGATCFGIYYKMEDAQNAVDYLRKIYPHYWIRYSTIL